MTALCLYEYIVGEGGCNPDYFLHRMQWWEVQPYLNGMRRRHKNLMDVLRLFCLYVVNLFANHKITDPTKLMPFEWDSPEDDTEPLSDEEQERQLQVLLDDCRRHNAEVEKQRQR